MNPNTSSKKLKSFRKYSEAIFSNYFLSLPFLNSKLDIKIRIIAKIYGSFDEFQIYLTGQIIIYCHDV